MTPKSPRETDQDSSRREGDFEERALPKGRFTTLWLSEVPKVIARHEAERLQVRQALGLA